MARVLVVDDAKFMRLVIKGILENNGHTVAGEAENGEEAIMLYERLKPDLVTMDITMPVMDGIQAVTGIMALDQQAKVIMCSAMGQQRLVLDAMEAGAKDFIVKPFQEDRVIEAINRALGGKAK